MRNENFRAKRTNGEKKIGIGLKKKKENLKIA